MLKHSLLSKEAKNNNSPTLFFLPHYGATHFSEKGWKFAVNELETCASFVEILVLRNKAKCTLRRFSGVGRLDLKMKSNYLLIESEGSLCLDNRACIYKSSHKEVSNARFLAGNTNKALCSAATLAILDVLDAITSRCRKPKLRALKSAMEEATEIWTVNPRKKPCFRKWEYWWFSVSRHSK